MKLSEVKGERVFDVMADLIEPLCSIATDKQVKALFKRRSCPKGMDPRDFMLRRIQQAGPKIIKAHKDDVIDVLCVIGGLDRSEYVKDMTLMSLWGDVMELLSDEDFVSFLASANIVAGESPSTSD
jgi:hypothetical protein